LVCGEGGQGEEGEAEDEKAAQFHVVAFFRQTGRASTFCENAGDATMPSPHDLQQRLASTQATVGVIGLGYVGLPLALTMADGGSWWCWRARRIRARPTSWCGRSWSGGACERERISTWRSLPSGRTREIPNTPRARSRSWWGE